MWDPSRGGLRAGRSLAVGLVVALVAATSHALGGGGHTSWLAVVPAVAAVTLIAAALGGRRLGWPTLVILLTGAQVAVHALSSYLHAAPPWHAGSMLAAHVAGVAVTALALAHGESLLWRLHAWLLPRTLGTSPSPPTHRHRPIAPASHRPAPTPLLGSVTRRGPPVAATLV